MDRLIGAANFIHHNMPSGTTWRQPALSVEDSWDLAAFFLSQPRPEKAHLDRDFPVRTEKPTAAPYGPYVDGFSREQHKVGPRPIEDKLATLGAASRPHPRRKLTMKISKTLSVAFVALVAAFRRTLQ